MKRKMDDDRAAHLWKVVTDRPSVSVWSRSSHEIETSSIRRCARVLVDLNARARRFERERSNVLRCSMSEVVLAIDYGCIANRALE